MRVVEKSMRLVNSEDVQPVNTDGVSERPTTLLRAGVPRSRLADAWGIYCDLHFPLLSVRTRSEYTTCVRRALRELAPTLTLRGLCDWRNALATKHNFGASYVNLHVHTLRTVVRKAQLHTGDRELGALIWALEPLREAERWVVAPPADFLERVLPAARNRGERCWLMLAGLAGLRKNELLGLRPEDYDPEGHVLLVIRQRDVPHRKNRLSHSVRLVEDELVECLEWTLAHRKKLKPRYGYFLGRSDGFVFPWAEKYLEGFLNRIREHLGKDVERYMPPGVGWHHFRRWGATTLAREGATVWQVLQWLRDRDPTMAAHYVDVGRGAADCLRRPRWRG